MRNPTGNKGGENISLITLPVDIFHSTAPLRTSLHQSQTTWVGTQISVCQFLQDLPRCIHMSVWALTASRVRLELPPPGRTSAGPAGVICQFTTLGRESWPSAAHIYVTIEWASQLSPPHLGSDQGPGGQWQRRLTIRIQLLSDINTSLAPEES